MKRWWHRKNSVVEPTDGLREFIYMDETRVVSLLAAIQGAIPESVTDTVSQTKERGVTASSGLEGVAAAEARVGSSRLSGTETLRRAVVQSTFRELWRRDAGVVLHDAVRFGTEIGDPISDAHALEAEIDRLVAAKAGARLDDIKRGAVLEIGWRVRADEIHQKLIAAKTMLELMTGREALFNIGSDDLRQYAPMFEVLGQFSVGLVPIRGLCTSHRLLELGGTQYLVATAALDEHGALYSATDEVELVSFTEESSYWRDLRTTLMSGMECTAYVRVSSDGVLQAPWNPFKMADVLGALGPGMRDGAIEALASLRDSESAPEAAVATQPAEDVVREVVAELGQELGAATRATPTEEMIDRAVTALGLSESVPDRRRALDPLISAIAGEKADREIVGKVRDAVLMRADSPPRSEPQPSGNESMPVESQVPQIEVGVIGLYW